MNNGGFPRCDDAVALIEPLGHSTTVVAERNLFDDDFDGIDVFWDVTGQPFFIDGICAVMWNTGSTVDAVRSFLAGGGSWFTSFSVTKVDHCFSPFPLLSEFVSDSLTFGGDTLRDFCFISDNYLLGESELEVVEDPNVVAGAGGPCDNGASINNVSTPNQLIFTFDGNVDAAVYGEDSTISGGRYVALSSAELMLDTASQEELMENIVTYLAVTSGMGGDPHLFGFDGSREDVMLLPGAVANVVSDRDLQVNIGATEFPSMAQTFTSFIGMIGFETASGDTIVFDAVSAESGVQVVVNGQAYACSEMPAVVNGASFRITRDQSARQVPLPVSHDLNKVSQSFTVAFDRYSFGVYVVDEQFRAVKERVRFMDFTVALHGTGHQPAGLLGRTIHAGRPGRAAPEHLEDFLVSDGILGRDFAANRFGV